ncbi:DUF4249 domain-containing protein [Spirosoma sordidisoli]|uniref:DUF4249 domain-containing protein n=1 Tax=Spirosoma sordidisoli TaxID=2502893 RepID=A0A4Q2UMQ8_9BACT|nr:DUF4249 domain-containing protein [Spirosoma sordidisoli]RYC70927.1 DUF4249 domain-containing protein [Spirosoma sordidisoli]
MKAPIRLWVVAWAVLALVFSCIREYQPASVSTSPKLIVEGQVTDQPGPYTVRLTRTADYSIRSINLLEEGATVILADDAGNRETLLEQAPGGTYRTRPGGLQGVAGRRYTLTITTRAGKQYQSSAELLTAAPPITRAYAEYRAEPLALTRSEVSGWDVYIDTKDPETPGNFYRYEWTNYQDTASCATIIDDVRTGAYHDLRCCTPCWEINRCYNCLNVNSDVNINGKTLSRQFIMRVPYTSRKTYYLEIEQQAISKGAYDFWKRVRQLTQNVGGLFDAAPAVSDGNLRCISDPAEPVFGYFSATGVTVVPLLVNRRNAPGPPDVSRPAIFRVPPDPCAVCENTIYRTPNRPRWWVD